MGHLSSAAAAAAAAAVAAAAAESFWVRAPDYSAAPRLARGMNPTMNLEGAITLISLSQLAAFGSRPAGVGTLEVTR